MNISIRRAVGSLLATLVLACLAVAGLQPSLAAEPQAAKRFIYLPAISHGIQSTVPGYWKGGANQFYVTPDASKVNRFSVRINVAGCGSYKITRTSMVPISNKRFSFINFYFSGSGAFTSPTSATGTDRLYHLHIPGCGYISGGPWTWNVTWQDSSQAAAAAALGAEQELTFETAEVVEAVGTQPAEQGDAEYTVEPIAPIAPAAAPQDAPAAAPHDAPAPEEPQLQRSQQPGGEEQTVEPAQ
jgi:hypothetical protein